MICESAARADREVRRNASPGSAAPNVLVVNPGSTSTKLALYHGWIETGVFEMEWKLPSGLRGAAMEAEVERYEGQIQRFLTDLGQAPEAVVGRGGFIDCTHCKLSSGVYEVAVLRDGQVEICDDIYRSVVEDPELDHAANYGIPVAARIAQVYGIPAFTVDPIAVDDFPEVARLSGYAPVERRSHAHALSVRAMGRKAAAELDKDFLHTRLVAVHLGGGITVAALRDGKVVDTNNALLGGGPFSPQRVGSLPMRDLMDLCYSGRFTKQELQVELTKRGGLISYLGDDNFLRIEARVAQGDQRADLVVDGLAYQVGKEVGAMAVAAGLPVDALVFSGGLSRSALLMGRIRSLVAHLGPILVYPGSLEMEAMAHGVCRVLTGQEKALTYSLNKRTHETQAQHHPTGIPEQHPAGDEICHAERQGLPCR
jgi:butyrate kinase